MDLSHQPEKTRCKRSKRKGKAKEIVNVDKGNQVKASDENGHECTEGQMPKSIQAFDETKAVLVRGKRQLEISKPSLTDDHLRKR